MNLKRRWQLLEPDPPLQKQFSEGLNISKITSQILIQRGIHTLEEASIFLGGTLKNLPNPFLLPDMVKGVTRILKAIANREKIAVYGDYDVDGITGASLLFLFFKELGIEVQTHIPDRIKEGYGIQKAALEDLKTREVSLVITADCGTKSHEALTAAKEMGLDCIVTDHHEPEKEGDRFLSPPAFAFINPHVQTENPVGLELAGVGVVFFLLMALRQKLREENLFPFGEPNLKQYLDLVALGTIADLAPLSGMNRILVKFGLLELAHTKKPGLIALKEVAKLADLDSLGVSDIGFKLGPRINAGGRISQASLGLRLLCSEDLAQAKALAKILDQCNVERQTMQKNHVQEALDQAQTKQHQRSLVVSSPNWHPGIVGLVASKLVEEFFRPSIAFSIEGDLARGSARSIPGIHILEMLHGCEGLLEQFGGHALAAGLKIRRDRLKDFEMEFERTLNEKTREMDFIPTLSLDCEVSLKEIAPPLLEELNLLRPYGLKNPEPLFLIKNSMGREIQILKNKHMRFKITDGTHIFPAIAFNLKEHYPQKDFQGDIAFVPQWNHFQGTKTIQLKVKDLQTGCKSIDIL